MGDCNPQVTGVVGDGKRFAIVRDGKVVGLFSDA
jgi:hypothetical protein